jgi:hypothetical protein
MGTIDGHVQIQTLRDPISPHGKETLSGTSKTGYPIFITKPSTKTNITAHGPSQPA